MIVDMILLVLQGILNILLAPLTVLNIGIDFISSIPIFNTVKGANKIFKMPCNTNKIISTIIKTS